MGPVVDVLLETRPLALVDVRLKIVPQGHEQSDAAFVQELVALRNECDNMLVSFFSTSFFFGVFPRPDPHVLLVFCSLFRFFFSLFETSCLRSEW